MDYFVQRLTVSKKDEHGPFGDNADFIYSSKFCPLDGSKHLLCMTNEGGYAAIEDTSAHLSHKPIEGRIRCVKVHGNAVFDSVWLDRPNSLVTVSGDQTARLFDVNCEDSKPVTVFVQHSRSVKTVDAEPTRRVVFATGARDGTICLWDSRVARNGVFFKPENRIVNAHMSTENRLKRQRYNGSSQDITASSSVTSVLYQDEYKLISSGSGDGFINIWDLRRHFSAYSNDPIPCEQLPFPGKSVRRGYSSLVLNNSRTRLFSNCTDGTIYEWNVASYSNEPVNQYSGHITGSFHVKTDLSPNGDFVVSGSSDNYAYVWSTKSNDTKPIARLDGHGAEVTAVAWSKLEDLSVVTCSDDYFHRIWRYDPLSSADEYKQQFTCRAEPLAKPRVANILQLSLGLNPSRYKPLPLRKLDTPVKPPSEQNDTIKKPPCEFKDFGENSLRRLAVKRKLPIEDELDVKRTPLSPRKESNSESCFAVPKAIKLDVPNISVWVGLSECRRITVSPRKAMNVNRFSSMSLDTCDGTDMSKHVPVSPDKLKNSLPSCLTPKVLKPEAIAVSPTVNLPNYVVDGRSPCRLASGQKRKPGNWLSDMQRVKSSGSAERQRVTRQNSKGKEVRQESLQKYFAKM